MPTIRVSISLDQDQDGHSVGLHLGSHFSAGMQRVITGSIYYLIKVAFNLDIHVYIYHKYSETLNTFQHAVPFKQSKSNIS